MSGTSEREALQARVRELEAKVHLREGQYLASAEREQTLDEAVARVEALLDVDGDPVFWVGEPSGYVVPVNAVRAALRGEQ